jgi:predicted  nucleic acid-binding Zn-ribbon protein
MNPITEISNQKEIDYSQEMIKNFWLQLNFNHSRRQDTHFISFNGNLEKITNCINNASETLLVYSSEFSNEVLNAILSVSSKVRVYLLTNNYHSKKEEIKSLAENCLIRVLDTTYQGSFVLSDIHSKFIGFYFNGSFLSKDLEDNQRYLLTLEKEQKEFFFQIFCEWFWKEAEQEILAKEQSEKPLKIELQPFDFLFYKPEYISSDGIRKLLNEMLTQKTKIHLSLKNIDKKAQDIFHGSNTEHSIYTNLKSNEIDSLNALYEKNKIYVLDDCQDENLWEFITDQQDVFFILNRKNVEEFGWVFELTNNQIQEFSRILPNVAYEYKREEKRGNLQKKRIYLIDKREHKDIQESNVLRIDPVLIHDLKSIHNENDFASKEPTKFIDPLFATRVIFQWKIQPPVLPEHSSKDSLYYEWEKCHNEVVTLINSQITKLDDLRKEEGLFSKFTGFFKPSPGKSLLEIKKELEREREKLENRKLSELSDSERNTLKSTLEQLYKEVDEQKNTKIKDVEEFKNKKREELDKQNKNKQEVERKVKELARNIESKNTSLKELEQKKNSIENKINKQKEGEHKESEQELKEELKKIISNKESLQKEIQPITEEKGQKEKELDLLVSAIDKLKNELKDIENSNLSKIDNKSFSLTFPKTQLPKIGSLFQNKNQERYLTIQNWEELEQGKVEAERLHAILCIDKKSNNQAQTTIAKDDNKTVW